MKRIIAANRIVIPTKNVISIGVIELEGTSVKKIYRLNGEQPFTEWLGGTIIVKRAPDGDVKAYKDGHALSASAAPN